MYLHCFITAWFLLYSIDIWFKCMRVIKHLLSYNSKVQMTLRWNLWNHEFTMLNRFFFSSIFNGTQRAAVYKAAPHAKTWVRFNSELMWPTDLWMYCKGDLTSIMQQSKQACSPRWQGRRGRAEERIDTIPWFFSNFPLFKAKIPHQVSSSLRM